MESTYDDDISPDDITFEDDDLGVDLEPDTEDVALSDISFEDFDFEVEG